MSSSALTLSTLASPQLCAALFTVGWPRYKAFYNPDLKKDTTSHLLSSHNGWPRISFLTFTVHRQKTHSPDIMGALTPMVFKEGFLTTSFTECCGYPGTHTFKGLSCSVHPGCPGTHTFKGLSCSVHRECTGTHIFERKKDSLTFLFFFFKVEISLRTLIPLFMPGSVHGGSVSWDNCGWMFPDKLLVSSFLDRLPHCARTAK